MPPGARLTPPRDRRCSTFNPQVLNAMRAEKVQFELVAKWPPPCLTTPPPRPPWTICRLRPLLRTPERRLSRLEAHHGLSSSPQAAPNSKIFLFQPTGPALLLGLRRAATDPRHAGGDPALAGAPQPPFCRRLALGAPHRPPAGFKWPPPCLRTAPPHRPAGCLPGPGPRLRPPERRRSSSEASRGLSSSPQAGPKSRILPLCNRQASFDAVRMLTFAAMAAVQLVGKGLHPA